jgi:hypothetical protein
MIFAPRRLVATVSSSAALAVLPMAAITVISPAVSSACLPGETGVTNGCAPFCLPGLHLDLGTGLCLKDAPPPPVPQNGVVPQSFSV